MRKDIHLTGRELLEMVQAKPGDLGKYAIIPGPAERAQAILKKLKDPIRNFSFLEYQLYTGYLDGVRVTVGNGGRYSADSAIIAEIACCAGVEYIIRAGSCGALSEEIDIGDIVFATGVVRGDGVTPYYVPQNFSTVADIEVTSALIEAAKRVGIKYHAGLVWTTDALLRETRERVEEMRRLSVKAVDMVSASLLTIAQLQGVKAGCILTVSDNVVTGELGFASLRYFDAEEKMIDIALEAIRILEKG
jgi:uridine phosphorylase